MIPDFQSIMLPLLKTFSGNGIKTTKELRREIIDFFNITEEEQKKKIPSGKQYLYHNRVAWAISYLKMAELITSPGRGEYQLTEEGRKYRNSWAPPGETGKKRDLYHNIHLLAGSPRLCRTFGCIGHFD